MRTGSILILLWLILGCKQPKHDTTHVFTKKEPIIRNDFKSYYDKYGVTGCFALYDLKTTNIIFTTSHGLSGALHQRRHLKYVIH